MLCANCGAERTSRRGACEDCGHPADMPGKIVASKPVNPRLLPGPTSVLVLTVAADVFACLAVPILVVLLSGGAATWWAAVLFAVTAAAVGGTLLGYGRTPGLCLSGARVVLPQTGSAPGFRLQGWQSWQMTDIRNGTDPVLPTHHIPLLFMASPSLTPRTSEGSAVMESGSRELLDGIAGPAFRPGMHSLVVDEQTKYALAPTTVVGRDPASTEGVTAIAVPDLARQLSPEHFRIEQDSSGSLSVTDLSSTHGTTVDGQRLTAWQPRQLDFNEVITAGGHRFRVEVRTRPEHGGAA